MTVQYVVASGDPFSQSVPPSMGLAPVIAADGGADLARALGMTIGVVVGDMDSISSASRSSLIQSQIPFIELDKDKDLTDIEAALGLAAERIGDQENGRIVVVGGHGGRTDHLLGNLAAFDSVPTSIRVEAWMGTDLLIPTTGRLDLSVIAGATVSIIARSPSVVSTTNLQWPLRSSPLRPNSTLGISNIATDSSVSITVESGLCHVVVPNAKEMVL